MKGGQDALHSQGVQALCQKVAANIATAHELRKQERAKTGRLQTAYPTLQNPTTRSYGRIRRGQSCQMDVYASPLGANVRTCRRLLSIRVRTYAGRSWLGEPIITNAASEWIPEKQCPHPKRMERSPG
jgi:hypothetical protein